MLVHHNLKYTYFHYNYEELIMHAFKILIAICFATLLAACNTIEGAGEDIGAAGDKIDKTAEDKKNY